jgi:hypothetical protein
MPTPHEILNEPDEIYFTAFKDLIKPPQDAEVIDVEPLDERTLPAAAQESFYEQLLARLEELSKNQQLKTAEPKRTPALYLGRRVRMEDRE